MARSEVDLDRLARAREAPLDRAREIMGVWERSGPGRQNDSMPEGALAYTQISIASSLERMADAAELQAAIARHYLEQSEGEFEDLELFRPVVDTKPL